MLDTDTKRRIDTARDILVGKVPDPKSQVEQITIALIYKFMDDMDLEAEELGGQRKFFAGDFARYGWARLMRSGLGGHEMLNLYAEAIAKMPENPGIPPLFRDIFKNAFLPYRDPETLCAFLKVIDEFEYDHSERLGDAFEYLLSVLGSQGDAGQFRTPRHIIDFIVEIVDPKKADTVLDPACGTAGFLISSYKHILKANTDKDGHSTLTPDERGRLAANFKGYDISPDMVRLSLVNLYLHGFTDPHIYEYDTLTSQDRWNEYADVILANPPFMSPKGGIKPHNRFSVQSKRSEVLFVDYIAEHLTPSGRAGIIVPEGIIFQSQTAYTQLRKMLVEECLVAVVSLPAGVFNPYSGVKTSILILDKALARQTDRIAFFKIENDGFNLGAQRRPIDKNDLPQVRAEIAEYLRRLRAREPVDDFRPTLGLIVPKAKIAANGDYNLSGERYRANGARQSRFPLRRFEEVCTLEYGASLPKEKRIDGPYPVVGSNGITGFHSEYIVEGPTIVVGRKGSAGEVTWVQENCFPIDTTYYVKQTNPSESDLRYLYWLLRTLNLPELRGGAGIPGLNRTDVYNSHKIPLPPLEVQKEIVAEIEGYQKVIDGARAVLDNYRPHIPIHPDWPMVAVGELASPEYGFTASAADVGDARFIRITDIAPDGSLRPNDAKFIALTDEAQQFQLSKGDILVARTGATFGKTMIFEEDYPAVFASYLIRLRLPGDLVDPRFYWVFAQSDAYWTQAKSLMTGGGQPQFNGNALKQVQLPLPPPRHPARHRRRDRSRAGAGECESRADRAHGEEDPGRACPRLGRGRAGPGGAVSHGRSRRTGQLPAALLQEPEGAGVHRLPVGRLRNQLHPRQVPVRLPRLSHARDELRLLQHLADQADGTQGFRDGSDRLRQGRREEPARSNFAVRLQHRQRAQHPALPEAHRLRQRQDRHLHQAGGRPQRHRAPNGNIFFSTQAALDAKITEILRVVDEIQTHSKPVIERCYREFLERSADPEEREYPDPADQIREVLIHANYMSQRDIDICFGFDIETIAAAPKDKPLRELHEVLRAKYGADAASGGGA